MLSLLSSIIISTQFSLTKQPLGFTIPTARPTPLLLCGHLYELQYLTTLSDQTTHDDYVINGQKLVRPDQSQSTIHTSLESQCNLTISTKKSLSTSLFVDLNPTPERNSNFAIQKLLPIQSNEQIPLMLVTTERKIINAIMGPSPQHQHITTTTMENQCSLTSFKLHL